MLIEVSATEVAARIAASHHDVRAVYDYWLAKRGDRPMPRRADLDPSELKRFLPHLMLVEVTADVRRYIYRLVGTAEVEARGSDPTGRSVGEASFGDPAEAVATYDHVVRHRAPYCHRDPYEGPDGQTETEDIIYLPLADDDGAVAMILVFSHSYSFRRRAKGSAM
jgi:hypothetical protein